MDYTYETSNKADYKLQPQLNLFNFESDEAIHSSPYILTSPRSLKACHLANIKPIELLYRSLEEIAADLHVEKCRANHIYVDYEQDRIKKLEICKLIRKHIITSELRKKSDSVSPLRHNYAENTSKSIMPSGDNSPDLSSSIQERRRPTNSYSVPTTPLMQYNSLKRQKNKFPSSGLSKSNSELSLINDSVDSNYQRSKSAENQKYKQTYAKKSFKKQKMKNEIKHLDKRSYKTEAKINNRQLCWEIDKTKKAENERINEKIQANDRKKQKSAEKKFSTERQTIERNGFVKNCEYFAPTISAKAGKVQSKESRPKIAAKKRNYESRNDLKQIRIKENAKSRRKDTNQIPATKNMKNDSNVKSENVVRIKSHDARILDAMVSKKEKEETLDNLACKANIIWGLSNDEKINKMYFNQCGSKAEKSNNCGCSEPFALDSYFQQIKDRIKLLKENCLNKELHGEQVRQLARELKIGMEQWQDQVLLLQWRALQRAQTNSKLLLENKRLKTQSENKERTLMHALRFRNVKQLDRIKQQIMKKEIEEKDTRIERLKTKREEEISNCRAQAHYTAELREQLRNTLTPETFDRKVTEVLIKSKFTNRLLTASSSVESKIRLG